MPKRDETEPDVFFWHTVLLSLDKLSAFMYNPCMETKEYVNMRVRKETQRKLKIVAALSAESMLDTLDRLVSEEHDRLLGVQKGGQRHAAEPQDQA